MTLKPVHMCCPCSHKSEIAARRDGNWICARPDCPYSGRKCFRTVDGIPILIPFDVEDTVCDEQAYKYVATETGYRFVEQDVYLTRRPNRVKSFLKRLLLLPPEETPRNIETFVRSVGANATVLVIGAGSRGDGTEPLWNSEDVDVVGTDIYPSPSVDCIADAHFLPFRDETFDGVLIQAVLEHVLQPAAVVDEIHRVLRDGGLVYAETPFMQQVHEGAYDFQRFTITGHRWLFRQFEQIAIGPLKGPAITFAWSLKYFIWALTRSRKLASAVYMPAFFILQLADRLIARRLKWDGASGVYFLGRKSPGFVLTAKQVVELYDGAQ